MVYIVKQRIENTIKNGVYNGQIYEICLQYLNEFTTFMDKINKYEELCKNADDDAKFKRYERLLDSANKSFFEYAENVHGSLIDLSDFYKYKA